MMKKTLSLTLAIYTATTAYCQVIFLNNRFSGKIIMELKTKIESIIKATTANSCTETRYREPLIGFASAGDPIFDEMINYRFSSAAP